MSGTVNQIEWAKQIKPQVSAEFDRVKTALEAAAAGAVRPGSTGHSSDHCNR
jgi:hypothetical protein